MRVSNSIDVNPIRSTKVNKSLNGDYSGAKGINRSMFKSPRPSIIDKSMIVSKPNLSVDLKLEVARAPANQR